MTQWEYKRVFDITDDQMNEMGLLGWELVAVQLNGGFMKSYFKRPILKRVEQCRSYENIFMDDGK